jgi:hypothetical protein
MLRLFPRLRPSRDTKGRLPPDELTYYGGDRGTPTKYTAIDLSDTTHPKLMATWLLGAGVLAHGLSVSDDGNRAYVTLDTDPGVVANFASLPATNGVLILDTSDIQSRKAKPQFKPLGQVVWKDGGHAQHTVPVKIGGKSYLVGGDEIGLGRAQRIAWLAGGM